MQPLDNFLHCAHIPLLLTPPDHHHHHHHHPLHHWYVICRFRCAAHPEWTHAHVWCSLRPIIIHPQLYIVLQISSYHIQQRKINPWHSICHEISIPHSAYVYFWLRTVLPQASLFSFDVSVTLIVINFTDPLKGYHVFITQWIFLIQLQWHYPVQYVCVMSLTPGPHLLLWHLLFQQQKTPASHLLGECTVTSAANFIPF